MRDVLALGELVGPWSDENGSIHVDDARIAEVLQATGYPMGTDGDRTEEILRLIISDLADEPLMMRIGNWHVDLPVTLFQSGVASALIVGAIEAAGVSSTAVVVLAAVVPFLVDVERVEISASDRMVFAALKADLATPHERRTLWERLPDDLKHELTYLEFVDLLDRLEQAGLIRKDADERYGLRSSRGTFQGRLGHRARRTNDLED